MRNRLPVCQRTTQPAVVDVILRAALRGRGDGILRLTLGADEQHTSASGHNVPHREQRLMQQWHGLGQIHDVDVVANAENVLTHFRVPPLSAVAEMRACLQKLAQTEVRQCH